MRRLKLVQFQSLRKSDYWSNLLGEHPLIETASWNNISNDINLLLENSQWIIEHSKKVESWWIEYKKQLKQNIAKIVAAKSEPAKSKVYDVCNKYVWSKDGNEKIRMIVRRAEKEHKAETLDIVCSRRKNTI